MNHHTDETAVTGMGGEKTKQILGDSVQETTSGKESIMCPTVVHAYAVLYVKVYTVCKSFETAPSLHPASVNMTTPLSVLIQKSRNGTNLSARITVHPVHRPFIHHHSFSVGRVNAGPFSRPQQQHPSFLEWCIAHGRVSQ